MKRRPAKVHPLVDAASEYIGYTAKANRSSTFGQQAGVNGLNWDGAFIDVVAKESGVLIPSCTYTPAALAAFIRTGRTFHVPKAGDIVFFAFATEDGERLAAPHVGIVTDVTAWKKHRSFKTVEAQVSQGTPRGNQDINGVYERIRYETDVLAFARPAKRGLPTGDMKGLSDGLPKVLPAYLTRCLSAAKAATASAEHRKAVELVQTALATEVGLREADRGVYNGKTRSAFAAFQRSIGYVDPDGLPDATSLRMLAVRQQPQTFYVPEDLTQER